MRKDTNPQILCKECLKKRMASHKVDVLRSSDVNLSRIFLFAAFACVGLKWSGSTVTTNVFASLSFVYMLFLIGGIDKSGLKTLSYIISTIHAALVAAVAFYLLYGERFDALEDLSAHHINERALFQVSAAYLLADTVYVSLWYMPTSTVVHHVVGIVGLCLLQLLSTGRGLGLYFLLTEASTVPLNISWYLRENKIGGWKRLLSGLVLLVTFIGIRVVMAPFVLVSILDSTQPLIIIGIALSSALPIVALNLWWAYRLVCIVVGRG